MMVVGVFLIILAVRTYEEPEQTQLQPDIVCIDGIEYYRFQSTGITARFTADSKVVTCGGS